MAAARPAPQSTPIAVELRTPARLHLGMFSFGVPEARAFGGVGVMVDRPGVHLRLRRAERLEARGPLAERALEFARTCLRAWNLPDSGCAIEVVNAAPPHAGLGSGTQLALAVAAGMRRLFRPSGEAVDPPAAPHPAQSAADVTEHEWGFDIGDAIELARLTGRGRRSCVGVYGFSRGGLILESGRVPRPGDDDDATRDFSPMVARVRLPSAWRCVVLLGREAVGLHGDAERAAFARLPPVPAAVTGELARIALLELLPAAVEGKFIEFALAVGRYGAAAGKPFATESAALPHAAATAQLLELLTELGAPGCAQSSWGPAVIACCESLEAAGALVERLDGLGLARHHEIVIARFDNQGATLRVLA